VGADAEGGQCTGAARGARPARRRGAGRLAPTFNLLVLWLNSKFLQIFE
jgi:hypothetical protein